MEPRDFATEIAKKAGAVMLENFKFGMSKKWKSDNTPVTDTDFKVNAMLIEGVQKNFPGHGVLAEEENAHVEGSEYVWVCDPVDGTIPFSHGIPVSTFSLALTHNGKSILGVVYDPFQDRLYVGEEGKGSTMNGEKISVSARDQFTGTVGSYEMFETFKYDVSALADHLMRKENVKMMRLCSIIYPTMLVAAGELGFTFFPGRTAHDGAALKIIVEEAGGKVTDLFGDEQRYDTEIKGFLASNGLFHDRLVALVKELVSPTVQILKQ